MAVAFDLISAEYGWTDDQILDLPLRRIRQISAAIGRRQWLDDLAHRRLETSKLRTLCTYVAATMQLAEGANNVMMDEAAGLSLGPGTEPGEGFATLTETAGAPNPVPPPAESVGNAADRPDVVRVGQPSAIPAGMRVPDLSRIAAALGGPA